MNSNRQIAVVRGGFVLVAQVSTHLFGLIDRWRREQACLCESARRNSYDESERRYAELIARQTERTAEGVKREQRRLLEVATSLPIDLLVSAPSAIRCVRQANAGNEAPASTITTKD